MLKEEIWIEKYRPKKLDEIVGQDEVIKRLKSYVQTRNLPHLLFSGPPGVGKTAAAICVARELFGEAWANNFTELNASDERGIDVVRNKIKNFARTAPLGEAEFKIIFLDEADALTSDAQSALRRTMERYTATCRFILSCNYSSKIIEPIQSRCAVYRFKPISKAAVAERIRYIASEEGVHKLFNWDEIPGNDSIKLIEFLKQDFGIKWAKEEKINKTIDGNTISISDENKSLSFKLNKEKTKAILTTDYGKTISESDENDSLPSRITNEKTDATFAGDNQKKKEFIVKIETGKTNVYESINLTEEGLEAIIYVAAGDMRRAINALQAAAMLDKTVDDNAIYKTTLMAKPDEVKDLIKIGLKGDFKQARAKLDYLLIEQGLSGEDIIGQIHRAMLDIKFDMNIDDKTIVDLIDHIGEIDFRMAEGANERIQLEALIAHFMLCGAAKK